MLCAAHNIGDIALAPVWQFLLRWSNHNPTRIPRLNWPENWGDGSGFDLNKIAKQELEHSISPMLCAAHNIHSRLSCFFSSWRNSLGGNEFWGFGDIWPDKVDVMDPGCRWSCRWWWWWWWWWW